MSLLPGGDPYIATLEVSAGFSWVLSVWFVAAAIAVNLRKNGAEHAAAGMLWSRPNHASLVAFASSPAQPNEPFQPHMIVRLYCLQVHPTPRGGQTPEHPPTPRSPITYPLLPHTRSTQTPPLPLPHPQTPPPSP